MARRVAAWVLAVAAGSGMARAADLPPLLSEDLAQALAGELSGEAAKRTVEHLAQHHRMRASRGFSAATAYVEGQLRAFGLEDVEVLRFPADGTQFYGTQKARPAWDVEFAELWEARDGRRVARLASWEAAPIGLAQDSETADVTADLVDVGEGTSEADYAGRDVRGRLVLAGAQPGAVAALAVRRFGAAGIVSYAPNQRTAWWKEDDRLVRWGHLETFSDVRTFAFMISLREARALRERLSRGETVRLHAAVRAGRHPGRYEIATAAVRGGDPRRAGEEIAFTCHLDHPKPGANDNASGCATILEVARAAAKLVREGRMPRPARTLRFYWPAEIEGTTVLLSARPDIVARTRAVVHMDMVGGGPDTKAVFHVTRPPASLPSVTADLAEAIGAFVNDETAEFAGTGRARWPLVSPEGGREPLLAQFGDFRMGSDHQVFTEGSFRIPAVYLHDWPDRYIHTNFDVPAHIDPTKLRRAGFIGAATALVLANLDADDAPALGELLRRGALRRAAVLLERRAGLPADEAAVLTRAHWAAERERVRSVTRFAPLDSGTERALLSFVDTLVRATGGEPAGPAPAEGPVYRRNPEPKGPMTVFGYDYFEDRAGRERAGAVRLLRFTGTRGGGSEYAYEALNLVDGRRSAQEIRDALSAAYGPVALDLVVEYLDALVAIGVLSRVS